MARNSTPAQISPGSRRASRVRPRSGRVMAATLVTGLVVAGLAVTSGEPAGAAATLRAQSVGRLIDGTVGTNTLESLADVHDARATAPGTQSVQNPLDVTLLGQLNVPLTGVINLPTSPAIVAGAANQVAVAHLDGLSYGAAGAVSNSGGANLGGSSDSFPAFGTINLTGAAFPTLPGLPGLPGGDSAASLGGLTAKIGAVSALAQTAVGGAVTPAPKYAIAGLNLELGSPALGAVFATLGTALKAPALPAGLPALPTSCSFSNQVLAPLTVAGGAVTITPTSGAITINLAKLLQTLGVNINALPANTDLLAYLLAYLASPSGLSAGVQALITSITTPLQTKFTTCLNAIATQFPAPLNAVLTQLVAGLSGGQAALTAAVTAVLTPLQRAGGTNPLKPLADGLKQVIDIGINVESGPGIQAEQTDPALKFETKLRATPNQATPVVANQTLVRALEINLLAGKAATLALANAAAGPSTAAPVVPRTAAPVPAAPNTNIPTGVPAGLAKPAGAPAAPLILLLIGLLLAGAGAAAWKLGGKQLR